MTCIARLRNWMLGGWLCALLCAPVRGADGKDFPPEVDRLFAEGVALTQNERFDEGLADFDKIVAILPDHPIGYFLKAALYEDIQENYHTFAFDKPFDEALNKAIALARKMVREDKKNPWGSFFLGASYGYLGLHQKEKGYWLSAFSNGLKGVNLMFKTLDLDPTIADCYYGVGCYHYWRVAKGRLFKALGIFEDTREQGIRELRQGFEKGRYARYESLNALIRVYLNEKRYDEALAVVAQIDTLLPNDIHVRWYEGYIDVNLKRWDAALKSLNRVEALLGAKTFSSPEAYAECYYYQALCLHALGRDGEAKAKATWIRDRKRKLLRTENVREVLAHLSDLP